MKKSIYEREVSILRTLLKVAEEMGLEEDIACRYIGHGQESGLKYLAVDLKGKDLHTLRLSTRNERFSVSTGKSAKFQQYNITKGPWTATPALIKMDGKGRINYLKKLNVTTINAFFRETLHQKNTISRVFFHWNHQEKLLFRQKTFTEKSFFET